MVWFDALRSPQLIPVSKDALETLRREFPTLPGDYAEFLETIGAGAVADRFQFYDGLVAPDDLYDPATAQKLTGITLFGDDFQGYCVGFEPAERWRVVEVDPTNGERTPLASSFREFVSERFL